jgi:hypothetical protein
MVLVADKDAQFFKVSFAFGVIPGQDSTEALAQALYSVARLAGAAFWWELGKLDQDMWKQLAEKMIADQAARDSAKVARIPACEDARDPVKRAKMYGQ